MRRSVSRLIGAGIIGAIGFGLWRVWGHRVQVSGSEPEWDNAPFPFPPVPRPVTATRHIQVPPEVELGGGPETERGGEVALASIAPWIESIDGACPPSHPIKAKLTSGIYHSPGGMNYERTRPDRCYIDAAAAERDGLRPAKL